MKIGDAVIYVDVSGQRYNALVIHVWEACLNVAYTVPGYEDECGSIIYKATSIPYFQEGMGGNYVIPQQEEVIP